MGKIHVLGTQETLSKYMYMSRARGAKTFSSHRFVEILAARCTKQLPNTWHNNAALICISHVFTIC